MNQKKSSKTVIRIALVVIAIALGVLAWKTYPLMAGEPVGDVLTLAQGGGLPAVASLPGSDRFLLVWDMGLTLIDDTSLRARFVDSAGQPVGPEFPPVPPGSQRGIPSVTANPAAGEFLVTWWDFRETTADIYGQRLAGDGSLIGEAFLIAQANNFENWPPAVAYNPVSGEYLIVWYQIHGEQAESSVFGQRVSNDGDLVGETFLISTQGTPEVRPSVAASSNSGQYLVVWTLLGPGLDATLLGQRLTPGAERVGEAFLIGTGDRSAVTHNPVSDEYLVVWADGTARAARVQPDGSVVREISLSAPGNSKNFSDIAWHRTGGYLAVWEGPGDGENLTVVLGRELSPRGELRSVQWPLSGAISRNITYPALAYNDQTNTYLVVWEERSGETQMVRGRIYRPSEGPQPPGPPVVLVNGDFEDGFYTLSLSPFIGQSIANGWAPFVLTGQPSFAGERSTVNNGRWAYKVSGYPPFIGGLAQVVKVEPGSTYRVTAYYQLYPPGDGAAFLGVQDGSGPNQLVGDSRSGIWRPLSQEITPTSDQLTISLHAASGVAHNTNVYFDDVSIVQISAPPTPTPTPPPGEEVTVPQVVAEVDLGLVGGNCYDPSGLSLDEETGLLYILNYHYEETDRSCVSVLDAGTGEILDVIPLPWRSIGPLSAGGGRLYVRFEDEHFNDYLAVFDATSKELLTTQSVGSLSSDQTILVDTTAGRLYLTLFDHLELRSSEDLSLIANLPLEVKLDYETPSPIAVGDGRVYVAQGNRIEVYDTHTLELSATLQEQEGIFYRLQLNEDGTRLYARLKQEGLHYGEFNEELLTFDTTTDQLLNRLGPYDGAVTAWDEDAGRVYLINFEDSRKVLTAVDADSGQLLATLPPVSTTSTLWDPTHGLLYMLHGDRHSLVSIDLAAMELGDYIPVGIELKDMVLDPSAGRIYVSDSGGQVHVLDGTTYEHLAILPGRGELTLDDANRRLYVAEEYGEEVTVLDLDTLSLAGTIPEGGYVSVDGERNRVFVGHYIPYEGPREGDEGVRVFDGTTLEQIDTAPISGIPTYNPLADELYVINLTAHILDGETLEITGDLTPDVTEMNKVVPWCNGCSVVTAVQVYPERNLLVVDVTPLGAGKGAGSYPPPRFFDATTRETISQPVTLEDTCMGELITDPIDGRIYVYRYYSRYVRYENLVIYDQAGEIETWLDGIGKVLPNPLTKQAYVPREDGILVLDLETLNPIGMMPDYCLHSLDFEADRLYAMEGSTLTVLSSSGGDPLPPLPSEAGDLPASQILAIEPSPNFATDRTVFVVNQGVYRSTDAGEHWVKLGGGLPTDQDQNIAISPAFAQDHTIFASSRTREWRGNGVYRSTDSGETWRPMWQGLNHLRVYKPVISPEYATDGTLLAYADYNSLATGGWTGESVFVSTDWGEHWNLVAMQPSGEAGELLGPEDLLPIPETTVQFQVADYGNGIERSTDGGATWQVIRVFKEAPEWWGQLQDIVISPNFEQDNTVYALGGDALYRSNDQGDTWQMLSDERIGERGLENYLKVITLAPGHGGSHYVFLGSNAGDFLVIQPEKSEWREAEVLVPPS